MHVKRIGTQTVEDDTDVPQISDTTLCYYMNIAYATSIGGIGTLVGTATNSTFKGIYESRFPEAPPIDFLKWMLFNIPLMLITELLVFIWLQVIYMGMFRPKSEAVKNTAIDKELGVATKRIISEQYVALGPMSFHEKASGGIFILAIFLYVFRSPGFCLGWAHFLTDLPAKESVPTVIIVILMFVVPMSPDFLKIFTSQTYDEMPTKPSPGVITWKICNKQIPWGLMFLLGSGFALAEGSRVSHMSTLIGESLHSLTFLPPTLVLFLVVLVALVITEFTTNVTTASILLPVISELAIAVKVHPLYLMMPTTIACSMVFLMPVGSPVNAVVMGVANIKTSQMMIAGIGPKIIATLLVFAAFPAWGALVYPKTTSFPDWTSE